MQAQPAPVQAQPVVAQEDGKKVDYKRIFEIAGLALVLAAALFGFIFTFVVGLVSSGSGELSQVAGEKSMLWDYFKKVYDDLAAMGDLGDYKYAYTAGPAIGTAISALGLLSVIIFAVVTAFKAYQKFAAKKDVNVAVPAIMTFVCYGAFATLFAYYGGFKISAKATGYSGGGTVKFNGATTAGLAVGGVLCGLGIIALLASQYGQLKQRLKSVVAALLAAVTVVLVLGLASLRSVNVNFTEDSVKFDISAGISSFASITALFADLLGGDVQLSDLNSFATNSIIGSIAVITVVATALIMFSSVMNKLLNANANVKKTNIIVAAVEILAFSALYLVMSILSLNQLKDIFKAVKFKTAPAAGIALVVVGVINVVAAVACTIIKAPQQEQQQ